VFPKAGKNELFIESLFECFLCSVCVDSRAGRGSNLKWFKYGAVLGAVRFAPHGSFNTCENDYFFCILYFERLNGGHVVPFSFISM